MAVTSWKYSWDRANRMLSAGSTSYAYDGMSNRFKQTVGSTVTQYLLDLQPGLAVVLSATSGANTDRYIHAPRGIHAQKDTTNNCEWLLQDGLGSVRGVIDSSNAVLWSGSYDPFVYVQLAGAVCSAYSITPTLNRLSISFEAIALPPTSQCRQPQGRVSTHALQSEGLRSARTASSFRMSSLFPSP